MSASRESAAQPHVLLLATQRWPTGARLGMALRAVGFRLSSWCPRDHPLLLTNTVDRDYRNSVVGPDSLQAAVLDANPDLIVPCDEPAVLRLQTLALRAQTTPRLHRVLEVIERSLGSPADLNRLTERAYVLEAARNGGVAVPPTARIASSAELHAWLNQQGFPAFVKTDGTFGGIGVCLANTYEEGDAAFRALAQPPRMLRACVRLAIDRDSSMIEPAIHRRRPAVSVQGAVDGTEANSAIFCWQGQVLASIHMQVVTTWYRRGPSTVVRHIQNAAMDRAAGILASRLKLSGFYGLDFILEAPASGEQDSTPWLIEMNSRATQTAHLALGPGHDLAAAAFAAISQRPVQPRPLLTETPTIALFPQEWRRDPASPLIRSGYHDVPWDSPALVRAFTNQRTTWRYRLTRRYWRERKQQKPSVAASTSSTVETTSPRLS